MEGGQVQMTSDALGECGRRSKFFGLSLPKTTSSLVLRYLTC